MAGTPKRLAGPLALTTTLGTNLFNQGSALLYSVVTHIHVVNKSAADATFSLWLGATGANAAGTELFSLQTVKANTAATTNTQYFDWYGNLFMASTDFLVGGASANTALTITVEGYQAAV